MLCIGCDKLNKMECIAFPHVVYKLNIARFENEYIAKSSLIIIQIMIPCFILK